MKRLYFSFIFSFILFVINLLTYSIIFGMLNSKDNIFLFLWSISNYITFFILLGSIEQILFLKNNKINKKDRIIWFIILIVLEILIFLLGSYISVIIKQNNFYIYFIAEIILIIIFSILSWLFLYKKSNILGKLIDYSNEKVFIEMEKDIHNYYFDKDKINNNIKYKERVNISLASFFTILVYAFYLLFIMFTNFVCDHVGIIQFIIASILVLLTIYFNNKKLLKLKTNNKKQFLVENGFLLIGFIIYILVEWFILPVTFNALLIIFCFLFLIPVILTHKKIIEIFYEKYDNKKNK